MAGPKPGTSGTGEKASPLYVVVEESIGNNIFKWVKFLLYFCLFGYLALVVITVAVETSGILKKVGSTQANEAQPQNHWQAHPYTVSSHDTGTSKQNPNSTQDYETLTS